MIPCGFEAFGLDATFEGGFAFKQVDGHVTDDSQVFGRMVFAYPAVVFSESDVQAPVQAVLDAPVFPDGFGDSQGGWFSRLEIKYDVSVETLALTSRCRTAMTMVLRPAHRCFPGSQSISLVAATSDIDWLPGKHLWAGLRTMVIGCARQREEGLDGNILLHLEPRKPCAHYRQSHPGTLRRPAVGAWTSPSRKTTAGYAKTMRLKPGIRPSHGHQLA